MFNKLGGIQKIVLDYINAEFKLDNIVVGLHIFEDERDDEFQTKKL